MIQAARGWCHERESRSGRHGIGVGIGDASRLGHNFASQICKLSRGSRPSALTIRGARRGVDTEGQQT